MPRPAFDFKHMVGEDLLFELEELQEERDDFEKELLERFGIKPADLQITSLTELQKIVYYFENLEIRFEGRLY